MSFNFPRVSINQIDISDAEMDRLQNGRTFVGPGQHSLKIKEVINKGPSKNDSTFINVQVKYEATNGGEISEFLLIPTVRLKYQGTSGKKGELFPFQKLCKFFEGLGETVTQNAIPGLINKYFAKNTLVGMGVTAIVGYNKMHFAYLDGKYVLADREGVPFVTDVGTYVVEADDRDTAKTRAVEAGFNVDKIQGFPEILRYISEPSNEDTSSASDDDSF